MHWTQIIFFLTWPGVILLSYWLIKVYLKKLDKKLAEDGEEI